MDNTIGVVSVDNYSIYSMQRSLYTSRLASRQVNLSVLINFPHLIRPAAGKARIGHQKQWATADVSTAAAAGQAGSLSDNRCAVMSRPWAGRRPDNLITILCHSRVLLVGVYHFACLEAKPFRQRRAAKRPLGAFALFQRLPAILNTMAPLAAILGARSGRLIWATNTEIARKLEEAPIDPSASRDSSDLVFRQTNPAKRVCKSLKHYFVSLNRTL